MQRFAVVVWSLFAVILVSLSACSALDVLRRPRDLADNTLNLREYWRCSSVFIGGREASRLFAVSGWVIWAQRVADYVRLVKVLDGVSGELLWEHRLEDADPITVDTERVYIMEYLKIHAYDLSSGDELWKSPKLPSHVVYRLISDGEKLDVYDMTRDAVHSFSTHAGASLGMASLSADDGFRLLSSSPLFNLYLDSSALKLQDRITQRPLWTTQIEELGPTLWRPVLFHDDVILVGWVFALDARTGQVKWHRDDLHIVSNFVAANDSVYALDDRARLVQLDIHTGEETGYIQFTPARTNASENRYWVAADGQMIFVSFDDSQEVIALGP